MMIAGLWGDDTASDVEVHVFTALPAAGSSSHGAYAANASSDAAAAAASSSSPAHVIEPASTADGLPELCAAGAPVSASEAANLPVPVATFRLSRFPIMAQSAYFRARLQRWCS